MSENTLLVVDDEESVRQYLSDFLTGSGYEVKVASSGQQALELLSHSNYAAVLLDVVMPELSGLEVLRQYRANGGIAPVIVLSGLSGADDAVRAMKLGATDYLAKPFENDELRNVLTRALGRAAAPTVIEVQPRFVVGGDEPRQLVSVSPPMRRARALVERIADTDVPVLLLGESGTGKEVIAREIHEKSARKDKPFIKINCAALPAELLESELFGHERGAFTGATAEKPGKFELADQGTLFLDEIGEMAIRLQAKLLQVLQDEEFFRVGGKKSVRVDARVLVATNRELEREIELGNFREDLFYRLNVVSIRIAPLRDRREDVLPLVEHFLRKYGLRYENAISELPPEVLQAFSDYNWPGNVRELENMVRRLVVLKDPYLVLEEIRAGGRIPGSAPSLPTAYGGGGEVHVVDSHPGVNSVVDPRNRAGVYANPFSFPQPPPPPSTIPEAEMSLKDIGKRAAMLAEREAILAMLQRTAWNKRKAATRLRISYKALLYKIKESGLVDPRATAEF
ncbi:MAG: sigma-54-dependent transcriptional regulator [Myxococcaceae bacterium]